MPNIVKVLSVSHSDFDGIVCQILLASVFDNIKFVNTEFYNIDKTLTELDTAPYDIVFVTDISPKYEQLLYKTDNIVLIDHHSTTFHKPKAKKYVYQDKNTCAALLVKTYLEKTYQADLSNFNLLVKYTNDYDTWQLKHPKSTFINELYKNKYDILEFRNRFLTGNCKLTKEECKFIRARKNRFATEYTNAELFNFDGKVKGCIVNVEGFINEIADKLIKDEDYKIVFVRYKNRCSIRHRVKGLHIGKMLTALGYGGGHELAAGMFEGDEAMFFEKAEKIYTILDGLVK